MKRHELLIHPVRSRIVGAVSARSLTTAQIAKTLPDVPLPTLYRQIRILANAEILVVTDERKIRGAVEKSYTLAEGGGQVDAGAIVNADDRLQMLTNFTNVLGHVYRTYVDAGGEEHPRANMAALYLTPEEEAALIAGIRNLIEPHFQNPASEARRRRVVAIVNLPDFEPEEENP